MSMSDIPPGRSITVANVKDRLTEALKSRDGARLRKTMPPQAECERIVRFFNELMEAGYPSPKLPPMRCVLRSSRPRTKRCWPR